MYALLLVLIVEVVFLHINYTIVVALLKISQPSITLYLYGYFYALCNSTANVRQMTKLIWNFIATTKRAADTDCNAAASIIISFQLYLHGNVYGLNLAFEKEDVALLLCAWNSQRQVFFLTPFPDWAICDFLTFCCVVLKEFIRNKKWIMWDRIVSSLSLDLLAGFTYFVFSLSFFCLLFTSHYIKYIITSISFPCNNNETATIIYFLKWNYFVSSSQNVQLWFCLS